MRKTEYCLRFTLLFSIDIINTKRNVFVSFCMLRAAVDEIKARNSAE